MAVRMHTHARACTESVVNASLFAQAVRGDTDVRVLWALRCARGCELDAHTRRRGPGLAKLFRERGCESSGERVEAWRWLEREAEGERGRARASGLATCPYTGSNNDHEKRGTRRRSQKSSTTELVVRFDVLKNTEI
eukprot:6190251-Pleurochrysis_carterae.AAC.3